MISWYYSVKIFLKLIKKVKEKYKLKKNLILKFWTKTFCFLFFKILVVHSCGKLHLVSLPTYTDYLISFFMKTVLEDIFEKVFKFIVLKNSFDFFMKIRDWVGVRWCLRGKISNFFMQVDLFLIGQFLFNYSADFLILNLYFRFISAGYFLKQSYFLFYFIFSIDNSFGFFLINIYLFELDIFMYNYIQNYIYFPMLDFDYKNRNSLFYIRVGFSWFLGVVGSFRFLIFFKTKLFAYLFKYLHLIILMENILLLNLLKNSFLIWGVIIKSKTKVLKIQLMCPIYLLLIRFKNLGFLKYYKVKLIPCAQRKWLSLCSFEIFWKYYLLKLLLFKFYFFVTNFTKLLILQYFLKMSLIFTLGRKLQLSKKQVSQKFKSNLLTWMS